MLCFPPCGGIEFPTFSSASSSSSFYFIFFHFFCERPDSAGAGPHLQGVHLGGPHALDSIVPFFFRTKSPRWDLVFQFHLRPPGGQRKKLKRRLFSAGPTRHGAESVSLVAVHVVARRRTSPFIHSSLIFCPFRSVRV